MAAVSLSPTPATVTVMSSRRAPLASNPNVINSPLRGAASSLSCYAKQKRSHVTVQREEPYLQPPALKKQALENGVQRLIRSPNKPRPQVLVQRTSIPSARSATATSKDRVFKAASAMPANDADNETEAWKKHYRAKFPKMVFYFESIPDDVRAKLTKRVTYFGARQEPFFSIDVTHVITTRAIPPERAETTTQDTAPSADADQQRKSQPEEQPQTINPSLLDRTTAARRKLLFEFRQSPGSSQQLKRGGNGNGKPRNNDVLHKAREMGKKIWSLDKFQTMLSVLLESETQAPIVSRNTGTRNSYGASKGPHEPDLLQLLHNERINGPSDRDPTAVSRELVYFKGPYLYVWDMDEKQKPIMARDYPKVANKADGEWPQFRSVANGRCPFVEDVELMPEKKDYRKSREREKARTAAAATAKREDAVPILKPPETIALTKPPPPMGKRTFSEMEGGSRNTLAARAATPAPLAAMLASAVPKGGETRTMQNAFISRAAGCPGRLLGGEPVASGVQPSNVTSAIRSQMISSASGINGAKAGTSKEVHGLQRKVLQKTTTSAPQAPSSRRLAEVPVDFASSRSMSRQTSRTVHVPEEDGHSHRAAVATAAVATVVEGKESKSRSQQTLKSKKDLKPGYCENCQEKFIDFDEHIASRKHRKFAENNDNWVELDNLLSQLRRMPKYHSGADSDSEGAAW